MVKTSNLPETDPENSKYVYSLRHIKHLQACYVKKYNSLDFSKLRLCVQFLTEKVLKVVKNYSRGGYCVDIITVLSVLRIPNKSKSTYPTYKQMLTTSFKNA